MNKIIAIVGMPGAGKSEASSFFINKGFERVYFGSVIVDGLVEEKLERTAQNEAYYRKKIRKELGMNAVAIKLLPKIKEAIEKGSDIILDGLYSWEEYTFLKKEIPNLYLLGIYAKPKLRHKRLSERKERSFTEEEAEKRDIDEIETTNKGGPIAYSDYLIKNEGTREEFFQELQNFLNEIENDWH